MTAISHRRPASLAKPNYSPRALAWVR